MKPTPEEERLMNNFLPGKISKDGFLGSDSRHIHDIVEEDMRILEALDVDRTYLADRLHFFIRSGRQGLGMPVEEEGYRIEVNWQRGMLPCPFGEPGLHPKLMAVVTHSASGKTIRYSQLSVHLIRRHGFFGGKGSFFRLEPRELVHFFCDRAGLACAKDPETAD